MKVSCHTNEWVMSHTWVSHSHMSESRLAYECVKSHIKVRHVSHMNESCVTQKFRCAAPRVIPSECIKFQSRMSESCLTWEWVSHVSHENEWVMSHIWMSHITRRMLDVVRLEPFNMNHFSLLHEWVLSRTWTSHLTHTSTSHRMLDVVRLPFLWRTFPFNRTT